MDITTLVDEGIVSIAKLPPQNWRRYYDGVLLTVPLIAEDYPAKTAVMWNAAYRQLQMPDRNMMVVANPRDLRQILQAFRADSRYKGGGAGIGFKEAIIPHLDEVTPLARAMGAVNIIKRDANGRLIGDNTDGEGYAQSLADVLGARGAKLAGRRVLMLGAGGSGRAIAFALAKEGANLTILNRTVEKALQLAAILCEQFGPGRGFGAGREEIARVLLDQELVAVISVIDDALSPLDAYSTIGEMDLPVTEESIALNRATTRQLLAPVNRFVVISDIRIRKEPTAMLAQARELGFPALDGIPMVINQGIAAFWWLYGDSLTSRGIKRSQVARIMQTAARK